MARVPQDTGEERLIRAWRSWPACATPGHRSSREQLGLVPDFTRPDCSARLPGWSEWPSGPAGAPFCAHNVVFAAKGPPRPDSTRIDGLADGDLCRQAVARPRHPRPPREPVPNRAGPPRWDRRSP